MMEPAKESFEQSLAELEAIAALLERGQPALEESLLKFERGVALLRQLRGLLDQAEGRIRQFVDVDENGVARLKEFVHEATHAPTRRRRAKEPPAAADSDAPDSPLFDG